MISEAMERVGNEGVITVEEAKADTELDVVEGMQFDRGYLTLLVVAEKMRAGGPYILLHERIIKSSGYTANTRKGCSIWSTIALLPKT